MPSEQPEVDEREQDSEPGPDDEAEQDPERRVDGDRPPEIRGERRPGEVDVQKLADKVYRLMLAEVRLERARGRPLRR